MKFDSDLMKQKKWCFLERQVVSRPNKFFTVVSISVSTLKIEIVEIETSNSILVTNRQDAYFY